MKKRIVVIKRNGEKVYGEPYEVDLKSPKYWSTSLQSLKMLDETLKRKKIKNFLCWHDEEVEERAMIKCKYLDCGCKIQGQCITEPEFAHGKCISSAYDIYDELYDEIEEYWHEFIEDKNFQEFIGTKL